MKRTSHFRRNAFPLACVAIALAVSAIAGGCSSEDYTVSSPDTSGQPGTGTTNGAPPANESTSSGDPSATPKSETPPPAPDAGADAEADAAPVACTKQRLGTACVAGGDCCSGSCNSELCVPAAGTCDGAKCVSGPLILCKPAGNACSKHLDCCSGWCGNGTCITSIATCGEEAAACVANKDCCSGKCTAGACEK